MGMEPGPAVARIRSLGVLPRECLLVLLLFVLFSVNFATPSWAAPSLTTVVARDLAALLVSAVVSTLLTSAVGTRPYLLGATFAIVYGTMYLLPATETVYVGSVLPPSRAITMVLSGILIAGLFSLASIGRFTFPSASEEGDPSPRLSMPWREWTLTLLALGGLWTLLLILFGFVVYQPIARVLDPYGLTAESAGVSTAWALVSQPLWGIAWTVLAVPFLRSLALEWRPSALALGVLLATLAGADMIMATGMSGSLQLAHIPETVGESLVFGLSVVWILHLRGRLSVGAEGPAPAEVPGVPFAHPR